MKKYIASFSFFISFLANAEESNIILSEVQVKALAHVYSGLSLEIDKDHLNISIRETETYLIISAWNQSYVKDKRGGGDKIYKYKVEKENFIISGPEITFAK